MNNNLILIFQQAQSTIHRLETAGYRFSEFRIHSTLNTDDTEIFTRHLYPYEARLIGDEEDFETTVKILKSNVQDDCFSNDPLLNLRNTFQRNKAKLIKSFNNPKTEFLLGVLNVRTGKLHAFRTGAYTTPGRAHFYQYSFTIADLQKRFCLPDEALIKSLQRMKKDKKVAMVGREF